jgi:hypothetical protein
MKAAHTEGLWGMLNASRLWGVSAGSLLFTTWAWYVNKDGQL